MEEHEPKLEAARAREEIAQQERETAEEALQDWQVRWDAYNEQAAEPARVAEVERSRIDQLDRQLRQYDQRLERLQRERETLASAGLEAEVANLSIEAESLETRQEQA